MIHFDALGMRGHEVSLTRAEYIRPRTGTILFVSTQAPQNEHTPGFAKRVSEGLGGTHKLIIVNATQSNYPRLSEVSGIISGGGEFSVYERFPWQINHSRFLREAYIMGTPLLGICYTEQAIGESLEGGLVTKSPYGREIGTSTIRFTEEGRRHWAFNGLPQEIEVFTTHTDEVVKIPHGAHLLATGKDHFIQALGTNNVVGVQFHPEVSAEDIIGLLNARKELLFAEGVVTSEEEFQQKCHEIATNGKLIRQTGTRIIQNFSNHVENQAA